MSEELDVVTELPVKKKRPRNRATSSMISPLKKVAKTSKTTANRKYIPSEGSGAYAILIALYKAEEDGRDCLSKDLLINAAQEYTTTSMSVPLPGSFYSGFNSIKTLINKNLVERNKQRFASYFLTAEGREVACKLAELHNEKQHREFEQYNNRLRNDDQVVLRDDESALPSTQISSHSLPSSSQASSVYLDNFCLSRGNYDIVLFIDSREQTSGVNKEMRKTALLSALQQRGIRVEMRTLSVGDFTWVAQEKIVLDTNITSSLPNRGFRKELVLDFVVERKRIDDLASSIKDRRWDEQKYRLRNCGVRKPSYLIEYFGAHSRKTDFGGIKYETLLQAITNAEVDGFNVKRCDNFEETVRYLTLMTRYLENHYKNSSLYTCSREQLVNNEVSMNHFMSFNEFSKCATKVTNFTVTEMFVKHLLQFRGISVAKAKVIIEHYPTLQSLLDAYSIIDREKDKENLLAHLKCGLMERNFGPAVSKKIYNHYSK